MMHYAILQYMLSSKKVTFSGHLLRSIAKMDQLDPPHSLARCASHLEAQSVLKQGQCLAHLKIYNHKFQVYSDQIV